MNKEENKCLKKCFYRKSEAKKFMKTQNRRWDFGYTNIYWCDKCFAFHLTTMDKQASRNLKSKP
jgi:hypothetical protein